jgi:hypothetical protein
MANKSNFIELALEIEKKSSSIEYLCTDKNPSYKYYRIANQRHVFWRALIHLCLICWRA